MNFHKSFYKVFKFCFQRNKYLNSYYNYSTVQSALNKISGRQHKVLKATCSSNTNKCRTYSSDDGIDHEFTTELYPYFNNEPEFRQKTAWNKLFANDCDAKTFDLGKCVSIEEVFQFAQKNLKNLSDKHLTQIIFAMSDLQTLFFYHMDDETARREDFFKKLLEYKEFYAILKAIENNLQTYNPLYLSYAIVHLCKLGVPIENHLIQSCANQLRDHLLEHFSLAMTANLCRTIFMEYSVRPYYIIINLIPMIIKNVETVNNLTDLENLTICLNRISNVITNETINQFELRINELIDSKVLKDSDCHILLKIVLLFNYPKWRNKHSEFISKCILLMENYISDLNFTELELLHEVLFKHQEPGDALNTIQRCSAKYLQQLEDSHTHRASRLKLFSCLIFFSSPINTVQFRKDLHKYLNDCYDLETLITLRKIFNYLKVADAHLCESYWNNACRILKNCNDPDSLTNHMENYMYFFAYNFRYRHYAFEHHVLKLAEKYYSEGEMTIIPGRFFNCLTFALLYCDDHWFLNKLLISFRENYQQLSFSSVLKLSQALNMSQRIVNSALTVQNKDEIKRLLNEATKNIFTFHSSTTFNNMLIRAAILRGDSDNELINELLSLTKEMTDLSSKLIETVTFNLFSTDSLIPETINKCTEYIVKNKGRILGFNGEKLLYVCYYLNYYPIRADQFFQTVIDVIIRDQERISGLTFLQAALALSYFNRMPKSFVKQIFNVEFLDKLDLELTNCYFKDRYPHRVRYILMQLNRVMCLEYPEYNIPWFHQKYIEDFQKTYAIDTVSNKCQMNIREYLHDVVPKQYILDNVRVPYGYRVDFVMNLDQYNKPTLNVDDPGTTKLAVLIKYAGSYTKHSIQLKGQDELKIRHLEILGYKVKIIKWEEFRNLLYAGERIEFVNKTLFS